MVTKTQRIIAAVFFFFMASSPCFAREKLIMSGEIDQAKIKVHASLHYGKKHGTWGVASFYYKLIVTNNYDYPLFLDQAKDRYYIVAADGSRRQLSMQAEEYPEFINPGENLEIVFSKKSFDVLQKELSGARSFIIKLSKAGCTIELIPEEAPLDISVLEKSL